MTTLSKKAIEELKKNPTRREAEKVEKSQVKNLPNMSIDELEKFAKNKLIYKTEKESIGINSIKRKIEEIEQTEGSNRTEEQKEKLNHLYGRLEHKQELIKLDIERMNFLQVIQML
jgi:hypothetical protein